SPFQTGLTNMQLMMVVATLPVSLEQGGAVPHYTYLAGSPLGLTYTNVKTMLSFASAMNDYDPSAAYRDWFCSTGKKTNQYVDQLSNFKGPVITFRAGKAFGPYMKDGLALLGTQPQDIEDHFQKSFGHGEFITARDHVRYWQEPVWNWLKKVAR